MPRRGGFQSQAMVEFALALPLLLLVLYGLLEVGRLLFMYSSVTTASREAARFGAAWGIDDFGYPHYQDCAAIRGAAKNVGILLNLQDSNIAVSYDHGPSGTGTAIPDCTASSGAQTNINPASGDRIKVTVSIQYSPILPFTPLTSWPITSTAYRTIMGEIDLNATESP